MDTNKGYVYIGFDASRRGFKIGKSIDVRRREREIRNMNPSFFVLAAVGVENQSEFERLLHDLYSEKRIVGEWFDLSLEDVSEIIGGSRSAEEIERIIVYNIDKEEHRRTG